MWRISFLRSTFMLSILLVPSISFTFLPQKTRPSRHTTFYSTTSAEEEVGNEAILSSISTANVSPSEQATILSSILTACEEMGFTFLSSECQSASISSEEMNVVGATGRLVLLSLNNAPSDWVEEDDRLDPLYAGIADELDRSMYEGRIQQPVLVVIRPNVDVGAMEGSMSKFLGGIIAREVERHDLCLPLAPPSNDEVRRSYSPSARVEIDGAMIQNPQTEEEFWDTSSVMVFDDLVDDDLRKQLLDVVQGGTRLLDVVRGVTEGEGWDDTTQGPDPQRWVRGGLCDTIEDGMEDDDDDDIPTPSWGLLEEATLDICENQHPALVELESKLVDLFPHYTVCRLPEAVLGDSVSPLTANAPTSGDSFDYHIDADPNLNPPSPWTDIYGRYPNRTKGKPRFMSLLIYLNPSWDLTWGAPTRFFDPPDEEVYEVIPRPGRCVLMDQDVMHTVVAPEEAAGKRPRYSLVWKLVLHPKVFDQDMKKGIGDEKDETIFVGSANRQQPLKE